MSQQDTSSDVFSWSTHSIADVFSELQTSLKGLSAKQASERLKEGRNALPKKRRTPPVSLFFNQLANPLMAILVVAGFMSAFLREWLDTGVIVAVVLLNAVLGFIEEYKADRSLERLNAFLPNNVHVRREGKALLVDARDIVPGDIVLLQTGDKITADGRLILARSVETNEAPLTGESGPVKKDIRTMTGTVAIADQGNMVFAGTVLVSGRAEYVVTATGSNTQIGQISALVASVKEDATPLQQQLKRFARFLSVIILFLALFIFGVGLWRGVDAVEMFQISVALAVAAIPESLVVSMTVILAVGMQRILKRKALVRRLVGAETLGSVSVICMDKTGTLTTGEMTVVHFEGQEERLKNSIAITNTATRQTDGSRFHFVGPPTEVAMARAVEGTVVENMRVIHELPFDSTRKFKAARVQENGESWLLAIGAPEVLFERLDVTDHERARWLGRSEELAAQGLRMILVCERRETGKVENLLPEMVSDMEVVGMIGLEDPLRETARETVEQARAAGLIPIMITGDHPETALAIARRVGLAQTMEEVVTGVELDEMSREVLADRLRDFRVFARVLPRHKLLLVRAWQDTGASVAMVGDGVNDAPAMKAADIGVALGSGTEVAKETADMVLLDNRFETIVAAIREGRTMFDNIRKVIVYLLSNGCNEMILIVVALLLGVPLPILPAQILWINLVTDGFSSIALTFEPGEPGAMREPPRRKGDALLNREMKMMIFIIGAITALVLLAMYLYMVVNGVASIDHIRTFMFVALALNTLLYVYSVRTFRSSIFSSNPFKNRYLVIATFLGLGLMLLPLLFSPLREAFAFTSLAFVEWIVIFGLAFLTLLMIELVKAVSMRLHRTAS